MSIGGLNGVNRLEIGMLVARLHLAQCLFNVDALVGNFNKEKALVGALSGYCDISIDSSSVHLFLIQGVVQ